MKKPTLILVIALLLPQVVFAAWWNPFSWKIFHKSPTKTQILEERVKELEDKLNQSTSTEVKKNRFDSDIKTVKETETPKKNTDYRQLVFFKYNSAITLIDLQIKKLNLISDDADRYIDGIPPLANKARAGASLYPKDAEFWNLIADTYSKHRDNIYKFQQTVDYYIGTLKDLEKEYGNKSLVSQNQFYSESQSNSVETTVNDQINKIEKSTEALSNTYSNLTDAFLNDKETIMNALEVSMNNLKSSIDEIEALRASMPIYRPPTNTNCFYFTYSGGGNINCYSY